jgi:hypothetical protein
MGPLLYMRSVVMWHIPVLSTTCNKQTNNKNTPIFIFCNNNINVICFSTIHNLTFYNHRQHSKIIPVTSNGFTHAVQQFVYTLLVFLYTLTIVAEATKTCRWLMIYVKAYFTSVHLLVLYINVKKKKPLVIGYETYGADKMFSIVRRKVVNLWSTLFSMALTQSNK